LEWADGGFPRAEAYADRNRAATVNVL